MTKTDSPSPPRPDTLSSVLLVDNHSRWRRLIAAQLVQMGAGTVHLAATIAQARAHALATGPCDLAILDLELPDGDSIDLITELRCHGWPCIVVLTCTDDPDTALAALQAGAQAYLRKPTSPWSRPTTPTTMPILTITTQVATPNNDPHKLTAQ